MNRGGALRMIRPTLASFVGVLFLAQSAWAAGDEAEVGRYQVIPDALVPGKGGKLQERTVLLDSATGRTWLIAPGATPSKSSRPIWVPIEIELADRSNSAARSGNGSGAVTAPKPKAAKRPPKRETLPFQREYDDDP